ncbi:MAG: glutamate 5-kinase [Gammaproteobacteria bacterium RIFCSPLOWO2_02_FULL_56_15]|nr:MAG: glutamate 5-kinase [Gammaproteobacteria bacterium RIFCSPLOWO2_02_FULL_56_15]
MTENSRNKIRSSRCWVVKIGSALLTNEGCGLNRESIERWIAQIMLLKGRGIDIVLVSSGAVAEGLTRLGMRRRPQAIHELQAAAAVGQMGLIQTYETGFQKYGAHTAQILLTHEDISDRKRYLNARSTLRTLVDLKVVPVINENDTVATEEIRFGDNDSLAGLVANLIEADLLVILTDQPGLYDSDPGRNAKAKLIHAARAGDPALEDFAGQAGALGRGGMLTKLRAASTAAKSGTDTIIAHGLEENVLVRIADGEIIGTILSAAEVPITARKQWLAGHNHVRGSVRLDQGAVRVLREQGKSLLAVGVTAVEGSFKRGEIVGCFDPEGKEFARGLVNYNSYETRRIMGHGSDQIAALLGYVAEPELIHRDNLILL